ncbi:BZZ1 [Verticillium alfalfae VaMs.102]|uniref:Protein BZZ1 n=1 Tax=Verticillium alfalfae (strain VaMs.102 / ATCC MYA-4576 / FGSC 10136) TaxID=526221 RepID=C9S6B5_VERA1|nr:BZZ1 [Verticillium alfalfae VaMs.102]EEY14427.1 BZZ1 [Verticillium alfalfae VaMs.102]
MAEVDALPTFGAELKDGFKPANAWVGHGITWLEDIQQFYRERSAIEKEYSGKLNALAKKYFEKKNKKTAALSVGDTPTMTPGSLESASLTTWTTQLTTLENRADQHDRYANNLVSQVAEPLRFLGTRFEELRKRHADFAAKLEAERDAQYADLRKVKAKYDASCQEVESKRKKAESSYDKAKAQSSYQQHIYDMNNVKNTYLIAINVTNKQKEQYYHEYIPEVMDSLQDLSEFRTVKLNGLWTVASQLEAGLLQQGHGLMETLTSEITRNQPHLDSMMYMQHNVGTWQEPADKTFEPSPVWHDDDLMVVDEFAKVFLRNVLGKSKGQLGDLRREVDKKRREVEGVKTLKQRVRSGAEKKDEIPTNCDLCGERIWGLSAKGFDCRDCGYTCHSKCEMKVPADCPGEQTKEDRKKLKAERQGAANALLKPSNGTSGHTAELPSLSRTNTMNSLSSGYAHSAQRSVSGSISGPRSPIDETPPPVEPTSPRPTTAAASTVSTATVRKNRIMAPPPTAYVSELPGSAPNGSSSSADHQSGKMLYGFEASGDGELSVAEGREVILLEPDDGSGWLKVRAGYKEGLVPATYVEIMAAPTPAPVIAQHTGASGRPDSTYSNSGSSVGTAGMAKKKGPAVAPRRGAKKLKYVEAIYEYTAQSDTEHSMVEGERFVLIKEDPGDGWAEVEKGGQIKSVPASYVQVV